MQISSYMSLLLKFLNNKWQILKDIKKVMQVNNNLDKYLLIRKYNKIVLESLEK